MMIKLLALDGEQHVAVGRIGDQHHGRFAAGAKRVLVSDDLHAAVAVAEVGGLGAGDPDGGFGANVAQTSKSAVSRVSQPAGVPSWRTVCRIGIRRYSRFGNLRYVLVACPDEAIIAFSLRGEGDLGLAVCVGLQRLRENVIVFVATEFESPVFLIG